MATVTPKGKVKALHMDTRNRLEQCWQRDVNWDLYPSYFTKVNHINVFPAAIRSVHGVSIFIRKFRVVNR